MNVVVFVSVCKVLIYLTVYPSPWAASYNTCITTWNNQPLCFTIPHKVFSQQKIKILNETKNFPRISVLFGKISAVYYIFSSLKEIASPWLSLYISFIRVPMCVMCVCKWFNFILDYTCNLLCNLCIWKTPCYDLHLNLSFCFMKAWCSLHHQTPNTLAAWSEWVGNPIIP